ncbi:hypothetical protein BASA83_011677 [Batrachochytrium salamandrivorans]|nr:hypothetical protein BASA83_011677 [Batrachochytrium salamandrivorans]
MASLEDIVASLTDRLRISGTIPTARKSLPLGLYLQIRLCRGTTRTSSSRNDMPIRIDNRIFERRQEQQYNPRQFRRNPPPNTPVSRIQPQQYQQRFVDNYSRSPANQPSAPITSTPVQQHRTTDDMDIDFARRGPLTTAERQQRLSQGLCLVCGQSGHLKATCPRSNSRFRPQRQVQAIEMEGHSSEALGNDLSRL